MEFKKEETKAALTLIEDLTEQKNKALNLAETWEAKTDFKTDAEQQQFQEWAIAERMRVALLIASIQTLKTDIENQQFDF